MAQIRECINWHIVALGLIVFWAGCSRDNRAQEAIDASVSARTAMNEGTYTKALQFVDRAIVLTSELTQDSALGENFLIAATCMRELGRYDSALMYFQNAFQSFHRMSDQKLERRGKIALADFYATMNENQSAYTLASDAAGAGRVFSDYPDVYSALNTVARSSHSLGEYEQEIRSLEELIGIDSAVYQSRNRITLFSRELMAYQDARRLADVRSAFQRWKEYAFSVGDSIGAMRAYYSWGRAQLAFGHPDSALRVCSQILGMRGGRMEQALQIDVLSTLGSLAYRSQHYENARPYFTDALMSARQMNNIEMEQVLQLMLIATDWKTSSGKSNGQSSELARRCESIASTCVQVGFRGGDLLASFLKGRILEQRSIPDSAWPAYVHALQIYGQLETGLSDESIASELLGAFMDGERVGWFEPLLQYYCARGKTAEAFSLVEQQNLFEINRFFSRLSIPGDSTRLIAKLQWNITALRLLGKEIVKELSLGKSRNVERLESLNQAFPRALSAIAAAADDLKKTLPNFRWLIYANRLIPQEIRDALKARCAIIEYIPFSTSLSILVATHDSLYLRKVPIENSRLLGLIQEYVRSIADPRLNGNAPQFNESIVASRINELSAVLANVLIEPIAAQLKDVSQLYIVPPEEFGYLPVHTLRANGGEVVDRWNVSYLPTAAALLFSERRETYASDIIGIGHPGRTSWDVEYELKDIRGFYEKARMLFYASATLSQLDTAAYDVLHFAAEFTLNTDIPNKSAMVLSDGKTPFGLRNIELGELLAIPPAQALLFSNISPMSGGFSRYAPLALLAHGTPTVIGTMWQGERKAKKYFGEIFYTSLQAGTSAGQSYHNAMVALTKHPEFSRLYRWGLYYQFGR